MEEARKIESMNLESKKKLLIIDDDKEIGELILKALEKSFDVLIIDNASEALEKCLSFRPDALLLDLNMPNIDGFELLNLIGQHPVLCDLPVVTMTANKSDSYRKRAHAQGSCGMIYKPFSVANLARDIEGVLNLNENIVISKNGRVTYSVEFNELRKEQKIRNFIMNQDYQNEPLMILSWSRGEDLLEGIAGAEDLIKNNLLIYLEIKPSLISKFPYLQNITPVVLEIQRFLVGNSRSYHLVIDEPRHLLNLHQKEKSISQAYNMGQMIHSEFNRISYINSRPHADDEIKFLAKVGKILTGVQN